jgi:hypothetical protein
MTQVTTLERAVVRNIGIALSAQVLAKAISEGPESIKANQVGAVLLNLKRKGLVVVDGDTVSLTEEGAAVHSREFPVAKDLDTLRHESNIELSKNRPMSVEELTLTNELIAVRKAALKIGHSLTALHAGMIADRILAQAETDLVIAA